MAQLFYVMTMPGLETVAFSEVRNSVQNCELVKFARGIALFRAETDPLHLLDLHTVEDVFGTIAHIKGLGHSSDALRVLHSATLHSDINQALALWRRVHRGRQIRTWRVVSQMVGSYDFRRVDAGKAVSDALWRVLPRGLRLVEDDADCEIWLWLGGSEALVGIRLSDASLRHRTYKREHLPASLRPTVAAAMGLLSRPTAQDIVLDPLCGAGTVLIERGLLGPFAELLGGEIRNEAVAMAKRNAQAANLEVDWRVWDARELPLDTASITRLLTNLPFGKQIGSHEANRVLYQSLIREFGRVLTVDGVLLALTSEDRLWNTLLHEHGWRVVKKVVIVILGQPASIFVAERV